MGPVNLSLLGAFVITSINVWSQKKNFYKSSYQFFFFAKVGLVTSRILTERRRELYASAERLREARDCRTSTVVCNF